MNPHRTGALAQANRRYLQFAWAIAFAAVFASIPLYSQAPPAPVTSSVSPHCPPVRDVKNFISVWTEAVIGPGSRSHACTLRLLTPDARITGVVMGKDGKSSRVVESPKEFVAWYEKRPNETFWEQTLHSTVEVYENVARATRTYEVRASASSPVTATGIEDFELIFDGTEWRAFSLLWQDATPGKPLPGRYLSDSK